MGIILLTYVVKYFYVTVGPQLIWNGPPIIEDLITPPKNYPIVKVISRKPYRVH